MNQIKIDSEKLADKITSYRQKYQFSLNRTSIMFDLPQELVEGFENKTMKYASIETLAKIAKARNEDLKQFLVDIESDRHAVIIRFHPWFLKPFKLLGIKQQPKWLQKLERSQWLKISIKS